MDANRRKSERHDVLLALEPGWANLCAPIRAGGCPVVDKPSKQWLMNDDMGKRMLKSLIMEMNIEDMLRDWTRRVNSG